jgi:hypothetical protein
MLPSQLFQQLLSIKWKVHRAKNTCSLHSLNKVTINVDDIDPLAWSYMTAASLAEESHLSTIVKITYMSEDECMVEKWQDQQQIL